jgi:hypothetical protein
MSQKISYDVPYGPVIGTTKDMLSGKITVTDADMSYAWQEWADRVSKALIVLKDAALLMDDLDTATATTVQIATAWNELRVKLQELA